MASSIRKPWAMSTHAHTHTHTKTERVKVEARVRVCVCVLMPVQAGGKHHDRGESSGGASGKQHGKPGGMDAKNLKQAASAGDTAGKHHGMSDNGAGGGGAQESKPWHHGCGDKEGAGGGKHHGHSNTSHTRSRSRNFILGTNKSTKKDRRVARTLH